MMNNEEMNELIRTALPARLRQQGCADEWIRECTEKALRLSPGLKTNLTEWLSGKPFSRCVVGRWTLEIALAARGDRTDVLGAIFALSDFENGLGEDRLWRKRL